MEEDNTIIRRLDPIKDRGCFVESWLWEVSAPSWFKQSNKVFGPPTFEDFINSCKQDDRAVFGVFGNKLDGLIILTLRGRSVEADLVARPGTRETIIMGTSLLRDLIFRDLNVNEIYVWLPRKNYPTRKLCAILGFQDSGLRILKGMYRDRIIEWLRLNVYRPQVEQVKAA